MNNMLTVFREKWLANPWARRLVLLLSVFGPATIAAMANNDASGDRHAQPENICNQSATTMERRLCPASI